MTQRWKLTEHTTDHQWRMFMRLLDTGLDTSDVEIHEPKHEGDPFRIVAGDRTLEIAPEKPDPLAEALEDAPAMNYPLMWSGLYEWVREQRAETSPRGGDFEIGRRGALAEVVEEMDRLAGAQVAGANGMTQDETT